MKLLKIIVAVFFIYFIRRFFQMYKVMKKIQAEHEETKLKNEATQKNSDVIEADFKVVK